MRRPLFAAVLALLSALALGGCDTTEQPAQRFHWRLLGAWPSEDSSLDNFAKRLTERVAAMSGGRLSIEVQRASATDLWRGVSSGQAELGLGNAAGWQGQVPGAQFFGAQPFGLSAAQTSTWLNSGGGQALWDQVYAPFGVKPLAAGGSDIGIGVWYRHEIHSLTDFSDLRIHSSGLGGEVLKRLAAQLVELAPGEAPTALRNQTIDATDGTNPAADLNAGLYRSASFYYPDWQQTQASHTLLLNREAYSALPADLQAILDSAIRATSQDFRDDQLYRNALALEALQAQGVQFVHFPVEVEQAMRDETEQVLAELAAENDLNGRIWASQKAFQALMGRAAE